MFFTELPDEVRFLQTRLDVLDEKVEGLYALNARIGGLPKNELTLRVDLTENKVASTGGFKH